MQNPTNPRSQNQSPPYVFIDELFTTSPAGMRPAWVLFSWSSIVPENRVWIAQCLCPQRHCIMALAFNEATTSVVLAKANLAAAVHNAIKDGELDPWCGLCRSPDFDIEAGRTPFRTLVEAEPHLREIERMNLASRDYLKREAN